MLATKELSEFIDYIDQHYREVYTDDLDADDVNELFPVLVISLTDVYARFLREGVIVPTYADLNYPDRESMMEMSVHQEVDKGVKDDELIFAYYLYDSNSGIRLWKSVKVSVS